MNKYGNMHVLNLEFRYGYVWASIAGDPHGDAFVISSVCFVNIKVGNYCITC